MPSERAMLVPLSSFQNSVFCLSMTLGDMGRTRIGVFVSQCPIETDQLAALMIPVIAIAGHTSRVLPAGAESGGIAHEGVQLLRDMLGIRRIKDDTKVMVPHDLLQNRQIAHGDRQASE